MSKKFIFTITTGRSGTVYLTELLKHNLSDATVYHERTGYLSFGINTPDASHFTTFNSVGNVPHVQNFWKQKFERDAETSTEYYIETSHFLAKAGLLENLNFLEQQDKEIYIIILRRHIFDIVWSYTNRFDFANLGFTWLFSLDYRYPNKIVDPSPLISSGPPGMALWYVFEMYTRAEYYRLLLQEHAHVHFIDAELKDIAQPQGAKELIKQLSDKPLGEVKIPEKHNASKNFFFGDDYKQQIMTLVEKFSFDPVMLAKKYYDSGNRLGQPKIPNVR